MHVHKVKLLTYVVALLGCMFSEQDLVPCVLWFDDAIPVSLVPLFRRADDTTLATDCSGRLC